MIFVLQVDAVNGKVGGKKLQFLQSIKKEA